MSQLLLKLDNLIQGNVVKRPSKLVKSPYVADISCSTSDPLETVLGHTAALGCCGLCENGSSIMMQYIEPKPGTKAKSKVQNSS